jgi:hypothetical protein
MGGMNTMEKVRISEREMDEEERIIWKERREAEARRIESTLKIREPPPPLRWDQIVRTPADAPPAINRPLSPPHYRVSDGLVNTP